MLENKDKQKIEEYVDKLINDIHTDIEKYIDGKISKKQAINEVIRITVNKFTPESKIILASVYHMMKDKTLQESIFKYAGNEVVFYEKNIQKELNEKFNFEIHSKIEYEESESSFRIICASRTGITEDFLSMPRDSYSSFSMKNGLRTKSSRHFCI